MKLMKIYSKHLNFHKFIMSVINLWNNYWTEEHQIIYIMKDEWYYLDDNKIEFKLMLITMSAEHQDASSLMNVHIIDDVNNILILWTAW